MQNTQTNLDQKVADGFGDEWSRFDQTGLSTREREDIFNEYFAIFPWDKLPAQAVGFDLGCGSGRWAQVVSTRVGTLHCIDASDAALAVARRNLSTQSNCQFHHASVEAIPLADGSADFGYSLGVLHHVPDTMAGLKSCVAKLKPGAPFLVYLYYRFDNRPLWFRAIWGLSDGLRRVTSKLPHGPRYLCSQVLAGLVYWPLARGANLLSKLGLRTDTIPLSYYKDKSFYVMRTDALDRFGTRLEQRFTRLEIKHMMEAAGLRDVTFSPDTPHWCAVGIKN
ncbi:class I SAM-dependent methyltransferase [Govanella unica]|uniref:Class I SAM-dependent methyltransferase n=1 Tax=Govanella unica TaxID=2975056 RepID=A0A9X3Z625_9PROT|nr:class I SAM-dependent methyltransferase [Govania unica]MDA5192499.1 class I SAM-dependent methyltransferase [Govania unica]